MLNSISSQILSPESPLAAAPEQPEESGALVGQCLGLETFYQLAGNLAGTSIVKVVLDKVNDQIHFLPFGRYPNHSDYIAEKFLMLTPEELGHEIDTFHHSVYIDPGRRFYLGTLSLQQRPEGSFFSLEISENDEMGKDAIHFFYHFVRGSLDAGVPLYFKPVSHHQEQKLADIDAAAVPRVYLHELQASTKYIPLSFGTARGRLRFFETEERFQQVQHTIQWHDIIVMDRVPDSIPRVVGILNSSHTPPLSHTGILASGWQIPNAIQLGIRERVMEEALDGQWVEYTVEPTATQIVLKKIERPTDLDRGPAWNLYKIHLEAPETRTMPIAPLHTLRMTEKYKYGTKAANLGELHHVLTEGSERLLGFYRVKRPPRENLIPFIAKFLKQPETANLDEAASHFLRGLVRYREESRCRFHS